MLAVPILGIRIAVTIGNQPAQTSKTCHHRNNFHSQRSWLWPYNVPNRPCLLISETIPSLMHSDSMDFVYIYIKSYMVLWLTQEIYTYFSAQKMTEFSEFQCPVERMMAFISRHPEWDVVPLAGTWGPCLTIPFTQWEYNLKISCDSYTCRKNHQGGLGDKHIHDHMLLRSRFGRTEGQITP